MNRIKMVVFDMAGTTVDEDNVVYKTLHQAVVAAGADVTLDDVLLHAAGKEKLQAIKDVFLSVGLINSDLTQSTYESFVVALEQSYHTQSITPQLEAEWVFEQLRKQQIKVVLNTGYNSTIANIIVEKLNWKIGTTIDGLITANDVLKSRPFPDMIFLAMQQMNITNAAEVVKVGDSIIDIEEGKNADCGITIGITTGAHSYSQLQTANPSFIIHQLSEILPLIA